MDLRYVRYAMAIARAGSLRRAATALHIAQPTLSEQLRALEKEIGVELFSRSSSGVQLTAAGEAFLAQATVAVDAFDRAVAAARNTATTARLGVADGLADVVARLLSQLQTSNLRVAPMGTAEQIVSIADGTLQAGLGYAPGSLPRGVARMLVHRFPVRALLHRDHPLASYEALSLADLAGEPLVMPESDAVAGARRFLEAFVRHRLHPRLGPAAATHDLVLNLVEEGAGYALCVHEGTTIPDTLTFVPIKEDVPPLEVVFLWNRQTDVHELLSAARHLARSG
ncbi:LysR family transcriptional regulator [Nonomuraea angiospora]|uniref:DNA-binding transcriptional LysR family regulator n=1 Tax=Nonomuraea angiospora TaxID=46172 RepID=A0ABR9MF37_9ACTN|nr:LysR family transcriptional regulator [Nonomuraea angiospora]MBE1591163.1 DNA-binding transcriptional LysR family regulator [Nonomuraea angiospora]MDX3104793.1 LysR family transcriptional regulator [Nonomuraea angiospora]